MSIVDEQGSLLNVPIRALLMTICLFLIHLLLIPTPFLRLQRRHFSGCLQERSSRCSSHRPCKYAIRNFMSNYLSLKT